MTQWLTKVHVSVSVLLIAWVTGMGDAGEPPARLPAPMHGELDTQHLEVQGVVIGRDTLAEVQVKLGNASPYRGTRGGNAFKAICYTAQDLADRTTLIFETGPLGSWKRVTDVLLSEDESLIPSTAACTQSSRVSRRVATKGGLQLGLTRDQVAAIMGTPTRETQDTMGYYYERMQPLSAAERREWQRQAESSESAPQHKVMSGAEIRLSEGRSTSVRLYFARALL